MRTFMIGLTLLFLACEVGCKQGQFGSRRWGGGPQGQGSMEDQKARATVYDPYPLNDTGPEIVGGRPRGFTNPLSEAYRSEIKSTESRSAGAWSQYPSY